MARNPKCNSTRGKTWERKAAAYLRSLGMDAAHTCVRGKSAPDVIVQTAAGPCPIEVKSERMHCGAVGALRRHLDKARKQGTPFVMWQPSPGQWAITYSVVAGRLDTVCPPHAVLMEYGAGAARRLTPIGTQGA